MKRILCVLLSVVMLLSLFSVTAFAAGENYLSEFELPAPEAPNYFVFTDGDASEGHHDDLRMFMVADPEVALLAAEYDRDSEAFYKKYGLWSFEICMQYDVSLDDEEHWQHTEEWDTKYYTGGYGDGYPYVALRSEMMEDFEFFWLTYYEGEGSSSFAPFQSAITSYVYHHEDWDENIYSFDVENHSLYIRCRYYMEWEPLVHYEEGDGPGEKQSRFSDWSESAVFGKNTTQVIPEEPTTYAAPVISGLKYVQPGENEEIGHLEYVQTTPESVWLTNIYYLMQGEGQFDGLETQVSIDGGDWVEFDTADSWGDWCLWNGSRAAFNDEVPIDEDSCIKLRIRFTGTHGPSEWSNVLVINDGGTNTTTTTTAAPTTTTTTTTTVTTTTTTTTKPTTTTTTTRPTGSKPDVERVAGSSRTGTAVAISRKAFNAANTVIIADGNGYADSLAGVPLAYALDAPILLVRNSALDKDTRDEIIRLGAKKTIVLGGELAVGAAVEAELEGMGIEVERIAGKTRFDTAVAIANKLEKLNGKKPTELFFAYSHNYADALSVGGVAAVKKAPILYIAANGVLSDGTKTYVQSSGAKTAYILGGKLAISDDAIGNIKAAGANTVERVAGQSRYATCIEINKRFADVFKGNAAVCVATGANFPDALSGGVFAAKNNAPLVLVPATLTDVQTDYIKAEKAASIYIFGGTTAVSSEIENQLKSYINK